MLLSFFFFNDTATTEIYTLSLHDALPIFKRFMALLMAMLMITPVGSFAANHRSAPISALDHAAGITEDRKSTRLNSSHGYISYAVFCLKKKKQKYHTQKCNINSRHQ